MSKIARGPTIAEVAEAANVGTATVDRVLNDRGSVRAATRSRVLEALEMLRGGKSDRMSRPTRHRIAFLVDSGDSYNRSLEQAVSAYEERDDDIECTFEATPTHEVDPVRIAQQIERRAAQSDGLVVVARESLVLNRALRSVAERGTPIVCLTTDLPNSGRTAYVGNDQVSAGETAAYLMGRMVGAVPGKILLVCSAPYRVQEDRELGFRRILRSEFSHLEIEDRVNSNDDFEYSYRNVSQFIEEHGPPAGIYNVAAGNLGIAKALEDRGLELSTVFIGHELNPNSARLLETGHMDIVIGHDVDLEVSQAIKTLVDILSGATPEDATPTKVRVYTKYNCS